MVDPSTVGQLIVKEMGNLGVKKIEVIGHKKSHRVEISLDCDPEAYPVLLNRLPISFTINCPTVDGSTILTTS